MGRRSAMVLTRRLLMDISEEDAKKILQFKLAAEAYAAAAAQFRLAAEHLQQGDIEGSLADNRSALAIVEKQRSVSHKPPARPRPAVSARVLTVRHPIVEYLKFLLPALLLLVFLLYMVLSGSTGDITKRYSNMTADQAARVTAYPERYVPSRKGM